MGKSTISMAIFNSYVNVYQSVNPIWWFWVPHFWVPRGAACRKHMAKRCLTSWRIHVDRKKLGILWENIGI